MSYDQKLLNHMKRYGARIIVFVHDMKSLMFVGNRWLLEEIIEFYNGAEVLIVPSENMKNYLLANGVRPEMKFVNQEIWDYTLVGNPQTTPCFEKIIHFAGNPSKFIINFRMRHITEFWDWRCSPRMLIEFYILTVICW